ncbi:MAG TPA: PLP-dependent aminotransferase family protein [Acidimicrobiia bacterium]|jgi:2-aminoadipate transaminase
MGERLEQLTAAGVRRVPRIGSFEIPADIEIRWAFEAGLPDPATFPVDDLARLTAEVLRDDAADGLQYGSPGSNGIAWGYEVLRDRIAERTQRIEGRAIDRRSVMLTLGGVQAITLGCRAFLDAGDLLAVEAPTWGAALSAAQAVGGEAVAIPMDRDGMVVDELERRLDELAAHGRRLKMLYTIATFNTPTGWSLSLPRRRRLLELAADHNFIVLEDNVYGELRYEGETIPTLFSLDDSGLVVKIDSFSKILAPALRMGWLTADPEVTRVLGATKGDLGVSQWLARVVTRYMDEGKLDPHVEMVNRLYREKRDVAVRALRDHCGPWVSFDVPEGGFFLWVELSPDVDGEQVMRRAFADGVMCRPGERFFGEDDASLHKQWFRLAFVMVPTDEIERGIAVLGKAIADSTR